MTYFEQILKVLKDKMTKEEFFRIYNSSFDDEDDYDKILKDPEKDAAFGHLFVAYHTTYPEKEEEYRRKDAEYRKNKAKK